MTGQPEKPEVFGIDHLTRTVNQVLAEVRNIARTLYDLKGLVVQMPTREEFNMAKQQLKAAIADASNRVVTDLQALRDQLAAGNPISDQDLADIQSDVADVANIDAPAPTPPPGP